MLGLYMCRIFGSLRISRVLNKSKDSIFLTWHILFTPGPLMRSSKTAPIPYRIQAAAAPCSSTLLNLPPEIFEEIIDHLVHIEKAKVLFRHRRVCRKLLEMCDEKRHPLTGKGTFDQYVLARRVEAVVQHAKAEQSQNTSLYDDESSPWSPGPYYCGHVVPSATPIWQKYWYSAVGEFIPTIIDTLVGFRQPVSSDARRQLRALYARDICNALRALGMKYFIELLVQWTEIEQRKIDHTLLAAAAAVGDEELFLNFVKHVNDVWQAHGRYFPNALDAAVAAGKTVMVKAILEYVVRHMNGLSGWRGRESVKRTGSGLLQSLRLAARLGQIEIAYIILEVLSANKWINDSVNPPLQRIELLLPQHVGAQFR